MQSQIEANAREEGLNRKKVEEPISRWRSFVRVVPLLGVVAGGDPFRKRLSRLLLLLSRPPGAPLLARSSGGPAPCLAAVYWFTSLILDTKASHPRDWRSAQERSRTQE